jgi:hypothetical protein
LHSFKIGNQFLERGEIIAYLIGLRDRNVSAWDFTIPSAQEAQSSSSYASPGWPSGGRWANQASIRPYLVQTCEQAEAFKTKQDAYRNKTLPNSAVYFTF